MEPEHESIPRNPQSRLLSTFWALRPLVQAEARSGGPHRRWDKGLRSPHGAKCALFAHFGAMRGTPVVWREPRIARQIA